MTKPGENTCEELTAEIEDGKNDTEYKPMHNELENDQTNKHDKRTEAHPAERHEQDR